MNIVNIIQADISNRHWFKFIPTCKTFYNNFNTTENGNYRNNALLRLIYSKPHLRWNFSDLGVVRSLSWDFILEYPNQSSLTWTDILKHKPLTSDAITKIPSSRWYAEIITKNPSLTWETICSVSIISELEWITFDLVASNADKP